MKAVLMSGLGGVEFLHIAEHPDPVMKEDELLVRIRATALNRADVLQRRGKHSPPKGVPDILGLEMAGEAVLIHAGGSGVGTAAIQLVREAGGISLVTAGSTEKIARCEALGAIAGGNYKDGPFAPWG